MPSPNLDLVRSIYTDWERGDFFSSADWAHPKIEVVLADGPEPGIWTGVGGMAEAARLRLSGWEEYRFQAEEYRELDAERVLVLVDRSSRGKASGLDLAQLKTKTAHLFHIRDGKVIRLVAYFDHQRALADLGLAPEADSP
jgi:ketosteroid isomerase-like protein